MPTFDVQVTADAYGEQQFPYVVEVDAPIVGLAEIVWPSGLFSLQPSTSLDFSAGESEQMLAGYRQRIQTAGKYAVLSGRLEWGGADSATMRQWLLAAQGRDTARLCNHRILLHPMPVNRYWRAKKRHIVRHPWPILSR